MKWIILLVIIALVAYWLSRGVRKNRVEDPDMITVDKKDYYLTPDDNTSDAEEAPEKDNPRH